MAMSAGARIVRKTVSNCARMRPYSALTCAGVSWTAYQGIAAPPSTLADHVSVKLAIPGPGRCLCNDRGNDLRPDRHLPYVCSVVFNEAATQGQCSTQPRAALGAPRAEVNDIVHAGYSFYAAKSGAAGKTADCG